MSVKVFCKLADCVNWDNGVCGAEEIRVHREGYCATYEEIPEEAVDELDLPAAVDDVNWEEEKKTKIWRSKSWAKKAGKASTRTKTRTKRKTPTRIAGRIEQLPIAQALPVSARKKFMAFHVGRIQLESGPQLNTEFASLTGMISTPPAPPLGSPT